MSLKKEPLISIVMPVKNAALYLKDCLDSIINQNEKHWELVAVDDHSSDESKEILLAYAQKQAKIKILSNAGEGIIPALQTAYAQSRGELIHRMDADDLMVADKLKLLKEKWQEKGSGYVITGKVKYFSEAGISEGYRKYEKWLNQLADKENHWKEIYKECVIASPCWLISREDFEKCDGFNSARYPEDYDLVFRFYAQQFKVAACEEVLHLWRDHAQRSSRTHEHYQQNSFYELKLHYYLKLDYDAQRPLVLWGAGRKGKLMAKLLKKAGVEFQWVSNNPKKHGVEIYEQLLESFKAIVAKDRPQLIITVAQKNAKQEIITYLEAWGLKEISDYRFFS